jgi:hypothetical protein
MILLQMVDINLNKKQTLEFLKEVGLLYRFSAE